MGLRSFYYKMEDKYFRFLDNLEKKGINLYKIVDPLEKKGIPTFLVLNIIIILLVVFLAFLIFKTPSFTDDSYYLKFVDSFNEPIQNESLRVIFGDSEKLLLTDEFGISKVSGVEKKEISLSLNSDKFSIDTPLNIDFSKQDNFTVFLSSKVAFLSKTINFQSNNQLYTDPFKVSEITCSNNLNFSKSNLMINNGTLTLDDVPSDCGYLNIIVEDMQVDSMEFLGVDNTNQVGKVNLSLEESRRGNISIKLLDKDLKTPISNLSVSLVNKNGQLAREAVSNTNGIVVFDDVLVGNYFVLVYDLDDRYKPITELENVLVFSVEGVTENKEVLLEKAFIGHLRYKVIDLISKESIPNVSVSIYKVDSLVKTLNTDVDGMVSFGVEENIPYKVVFNNENYIIRTEVNQTMSDSIRQVTLNPITSQNQNVLIVSVIDDLSKPVDFAVVRLWDAEENIVVQTITSDIYGKVVIPNLDPDKTYKLDATKGKFESEYSNPFRIISQQENEQTVRMKIGEGTFNIHLRDSFGDEYQGNIFVYDSSNDLIMQEKTTSTNEDGIAFIRVRADREVYFVIEHVDGRLITPKYDISANEIKNLEFNLLRTQPTSSIEFIGFYNNLGEVVNSVSAGQQVTARFAVHASKNYSRIVTHLRTGEDRECSTRSYDVSEDNLFIRGVRFSKSNILGSTTYTPCLGQTTDFSNNVSRNAKWFNLTLNNPLEGTHLIEADIVILDTATSNQFLNYRSEFYEGQTVFRSPIDTTITQTATKQPLYAQTKQAILFIGNQSQCTSFLCYNFRITNTQTNVVRNIIDSYNAVINNDYRLNFNINILENKVAPDTYLRVSSGSSLELNDYSINSVTGEALSGNNFSEIAIGNLTSNDHFSGTINFRIIDDVSDSLTFTLISQGEEVFQKNILINILEANEINVEMVPRKLIPFIPNDVMLSATDDDGRAIPSANVNVLLNDVPLKMGATNQDGLFGFILPASDLGDVLRIIVSKNGYRLKDLKIVIDDKLLTSVPSELSLTLNAAFDVREVYNLSLLNNTSAPLIIESITPSSRSEYVDLSVNLGQAVVNGNTQVDLELTATLTEKGVNLFTQKIHNTTLQVMVRNEEMNKTWVVDVPVTVRIVLGNALDSLNCLTITPITRDVRVSPLEETTLDLTIENKCTSNQIPVDLGSITAMIDWEGKTESGAVSLIVNNREYNLENLEESQILNTLQRDTKQTIRFKFNAFNVVSTISKPTIYFTSLKGNLNGVDEVQAAFRPNIIINNLAECIEIPTDPVPVLGCNWFSGFGMYNQFHGQGALGQFNRNLNPMLFNQQMYGQPFTSPFGGPNFAQSYNMQHTFNPNNQYQFAPGYSTQQQGYNFPQQGMVGQTGYFGQQASTTYPHNYPTAQYQNMHQSYNYYQFMDPHMSAGFGGVGFSNNMNCPQRPFYVKNNCSEPVDIRIDPSYGVHVTSDKEFTLNPNDSREVLIMGGEEMGSFNIPVLAKPTETSENVFSLVGNVLASVTLPISFMPSRCIQVTPQKLDFSNIIDPKYQLVKVMNTCFDQGYRLVELNYLDLTALEFEGVSFLNVGDAQGRIQPIKVDYLTDLQTNKPIEVWEIALRRNPEIMDTVFVRNYLEKYGQHSRVAGLVSTFRRVLIDVDDAVNLKFVLQVGMQPPHLHTPLIYHNVGMEIKDNFQWLILDNQDNWSFIRDFMKDDIDYDVFTEDELMFVDTSVKLTYRLENFRGKDVLFIEVPERELREDKFRQVDLEKTTQRCFMGMIRDFPIKGIKESSHIQDLGIFFLPETYNPVKVSIEFPRKHFFKLCFERPVDEIESPLKKDNKMEIYDYFRNHFTMMAIDDASHRAYRQGEIYLGVDTAIGTRSIFDEDVTGKEPDRPDETVPIVSLEGACYAPDLKSQTGFTGEDNYTRFGFDRLSFEYNTDNIGSDFCEKYYCDQEQFYSYLRHKGDLLDNTSNLRKIGEIYFVIDGNEIKRSGIEGNFCNICNTFNPFSQSLDNYISEAESVLSNIEEDLRKITLIKTRYHGQTSDDDILLFNEYIYMSVYYFLDKFDFDNLTIEQKLDFYKNMDVFIAESPNVFISNLKKFGALGDQKNKDILDGYRSIFTRYNYTHISNKDVSEPGSYLVLINKSGNDIEINIKRRLSSISSNYTSNILFYEPINPNYLKNETKLYAPFASNDYRRTDYTSDLWNQIQQGYLFYLRGDVYNHRFIDLRPVYMDKVYSGKIIDSQSNEEIASFNQDKLFLLNQPHRNVSFYFNQRLSNFNNNNVFNNTNVMKDNFLIYNVNINNYSPTISYNLVKDLFGKIKTEDVCFNVSRQGIEVWNNPEKLK